MAKKIKIKGKCPKCGSKMIWVEWLVMFSHGSHSDACPVCTNEECDESVGYGSNVKYRFINHRTVKIEGLWE